MNERLDGCMQLVCIGTLHRGMLCGGSAVLLLAHDDRLMLISTVYAVFGVIIE